MSIPASTGTASAPRGRGAAGARGAVPLLALTVGIVLADSAVVTLALPDILRELDGTVGEVAWVLIAFNIVLAVAAAPAGLLCLRGAAGRSGGTGRSAGPVTAAGIVVFAAACAGCALAPTMEVLIAARAVQALGGALALIGCLEVLVAAAGPSRGVARWTRAGVVGAAAGPVAGGLLTEAISWQSIFIVQVPLALLAVPAALRVGRASTPQAGEPPAPDPPGAAGPRPVQWRFRPAVAPNIALGLLSAALTAALFLLVLLLVEGWRRSPAAAALTVSVIPLAAFAAVPLARPLRAGARSETAAGALLLAGGLAALALLPSADLAWTIAPQALVGLGLGLTVDALTGQALTGRAPRALHGGWTITARHAGVVLGLAVLTPVFTDDLMDVQAPTQEAVTALVLDAPLSGPVKIELAGALGEQLQAERGRVPDLRPAFAALDLPPEQRAAAAALEADLGEQLERAAARAFRDSFLIAAGFALLAVAPLLSSRRGPGAAAIGPAPSNPPEPTPVVGR